MPGATAAINLVAQSFVRPRVGAGDEILISALEHHSNIVPWQMVCEQTGTVLKVIPMDDTGALILEHVDSLLGPRTRFLAVWHDRYRSALRQVHRALNGATPAVRAGIPLPSPAQFAAYAWKPHCRGLFETPVAA